MQALGEAEQLKQDGNKLYAADDLEAAVVRPSLSSATDAWSTLTHCFRRSFAVPQSSSCACKLLQLRAYV